MIPELLAEVQITYSTNVKSKDRIKITGSSDAADAFRLIWPAYDHIEFCYMLMLNRQNQILGYHQISKGGLCGTVVDLRVIFQIALKGCATSVILAHNHPSGNLEASQADKTLSRSVKEAGKILEIPLLDHLILTDEAYLSMADEGLF